MRVIERVNERPCNTRKRPLLKRFPPLVKRNLDHASPESLDRFEFRSGRSRRRDDGAGNAELARTPRDTLGHVPCRSGDYTALELLRLQPRNRIRGPADLERSNRLEILQFQVDLSRRIRKIETNKRRADRSIGNHTARVLHGG